MIIPIWKKIGQSTHLLAQKMGEKIAAETKSPKDKKATHTGTLDPMAEGIVVVLTGEDRFKKADFSNWKKTYEFEILFGVDTDSLDLLGLITKTIDPKNSRNLQKENINQLTKKLSTIIPYFIGSQTQTQPKFSAQRVGGKSGFDLAKQKQTFEIKENKINIYSIKILNYKSIPISELKKNILEKLSYISGDFRQKEIIKNWEETFSKLKKLKITTLPVFKLEAEVGKRTYVRALTRDISKEVNLPATTYSIVRTKNGGFRKVDCK
jgi:tRNA pseudouridine(55) synthase